MYEGSADTVCVDMRLEEGNLSVEVLANDAGGPPLNIPVLVPFTGERSITLIPVAQLNGNLVKLAIYHATICTHYNIIHMIRGYLASSRATCLMLNLYST